MNKFIYDYPRPMVTVDILLIAPDTNGQFNILLIKRKNEPFKDFWALPGGYVEIDEDLEISATRELAEETGLKVTKLEQFRAYGTPNRDPRGRTISIVFHSILPFIEKPSAGDDAKSAKWFKLENLPSLAFDHQQIIEDFIDFKWKKNMQ